jgi:hypothetical protein
MPIETKELDGGIGDLISGKGLFTGKEYVEAFKTRLRQIKRKIKNKVKMHKYTLIDYTAVTGVEVSSQAIIQVAELCKDAAKVKHDSIVAVVATKDFEYGLSRMSQTLMDETKWEHEVFRSRTDAELWIKKRVKEKYGIENLTIS